MPQCPICGKETKDPREINIMGNSLVNLCSVCHSYLICLVKPVSIYSRTNAQQWAQEMLQKNSNPYIINVLKKSYSYSFTEASSQNNSNNEQPVVINPQPSYPKNSNQSCSQPKYTAAPAPQNTGYSYSPLPQAEIKTKYTRIVKIMVYISFALFVIGGGALGAITQEAIGIILGALGGLLVGIITNSVIMMLVETAENTAIGARTALRNEKLLEEIRDSLKNSQK